jgi:hypothetical protein
MFWTDEDIQPAVSAAEQIFGKQAQYHTAPYVHVAVETPKYGKIWYGDISGTFQTVQEMGSKLATKLNETISVIDLTTGNTVFNS